MKTPQHSNHELSNNNNNQPLDAYLDGQLEAAEAERFRETLESDAALSEQVALQERIDDSLKRAFAPPQMPADLDMDALITKAASLGPDTTDLGAEPVMLASTAASTAGTTGSNRRSIIKNLAIGLAAAAAWVAVGLQFTGQDRDAYQRVAVVDIYQDCVDSGFKPLWVCEDDVQFAETFEKRQGVPLQLASLPSGREMVGLSYLNGLSENATSMLALVDGQPVLVLITTLEEEPRVRLGRSQEHSVNVFRTEQHGLAFFEVTPFEEALVAPYFERTNL